MPKPDPRPNFHRLHKLAKTDPAAYNAELRRLAKERKQ